MSNDHVAAPFAGILNNFEKKHLQGQRVAVRPGTNRDRYEALIQGWHETGAELISFGTFVAGVERFEKVLAERSLDKQYEYERSRDTRQRMNDEKAEWEAIEKRSRDEQRARS